MAEGVAAGTEKAQAAQDALLEGLHGRLRAARCALGVRSGWGMMCMQGLLRGTARKP